ncbi:hypothetical protein DAQ1742_00525 [Dickeya aquatica]|uniref:Uncharacterized protein n=1 Tax=Dickeya aquatica TaxID=1401087 RepID=A0A375A7J8_9GAMM|nr:hypothetical protein DAQ1742_00525 [Dickeya aquatica]
MIFSDDKQSVYQWYIDYARCVVLNDVAEWCDFFSHLF